MATFTGGCEGDEKNGNVVNTTEYDSSAPSSPASSVFKGTFITIPGQEPYEPIDTYEGRHRYDPNYTWTPEEEKRLVRSLDLRICSWVCLSFFALQLNRANILQAVSDNMLADLRLTLNDYNTGNMIFILSFLAAELPSQLVSKKLGVDRWVPTQMVAWSFVASFQAFLTGKTSFFLCRSLLGLTSGGFIPDVILYLSYWYTSKELPRRLSYFYTTYQGTTMISALLGAGILNMRGIGGLAGWRWLFALEGTLTGIIGVATFFYMPASVCETASWFRKSWYSEHEEKILVNRILRDDPSKGDMHNRQAVTPKLLWQALCDWEMWPIYLIGLSFSVPIQPPSFYISLNLKQNFTTFQVNLLTIPAYVLFIINLLWVTWLSEKINQRFLVGLFSQLWPLPCLVALELIPTSSDRWVKFALATLIIGTPYVHAINIAATSRNSGSVRTRTVSAALYNMMVQASSVYSTNIYQAKDAPMYRTGNKVLIGIALYNIVLFVAAKFFYVWRNDVRERAWSNMTREERETYVSETRNRGNKMLTFRFAH